MRVPILTNNSFVLNNQIPDGFLVLIDKPQGWTSFDVCKKIRNVVKFKKVGHAGTLDPFATGLLLIGVGKGTREMAHYTAQSKRYDAEIKFGMATDTFDRTGSVVKEQINFNLDLKKIQEAVQKFTGDIKQLPPMYSAKKVKGKALYEYARQGIEIKRDNVKVTIHDVLLEDWQKPILKLKLHVSKGTYIRSYANDLGTELGIPAVLNELKRTQIGVLKVEDSFTVEKFFEFWKKVVH
jgi:tRNA pseudouridine55 synthase